MKWIAISGSWRLTKNQIESNVRSCVKKIVKEGDFTVIDQKAYFDRITKIIEASDELLAFRVNQSAGVQDTINKAKAKGIPVKLYSYTI